MPAVFAHICFLGELSAECSAFYAGCVCTHLLLLQYNINACTAVFLIVGCCGCRYLPIIGRATIIMNDYPYVKYLLIGILGIFVLTSKE